MGEINAYYKSIKKCKVLNKEEERDLIIKAKKGNNIAFNKVIESNLRFVFKFIYENFKAKYNIPFLELIDVGNEALIYALNKYDENNFETKFITYAKYWIVHFLQVHIRRDFRYNKNFISLEQENESADNDYNYSDKLNILNENSENEIINFVNKEYRNKDTFIEKIFNNLEEKERDVLEYYFELNGVQTDEKLEAITKKYNIGKERLRQIKDETIIKIRMDNIDVDKEEIYSYFNA